MMSHKFLMLVHLLIIYTSDNIFCQVYKLIGFPGNITDCIYVNPFQTNVVLASSYTGGIFMSLDGGNTVIPIETGLGDIKTYDIKTLYPDINRIYCANSRFYSQSSDGGKNWRHIPHNMSSLFIRIILNPLNNNTIFQIRNDKEIWKSDNKGEN